MWRQVVVLTVVLECGGHTARRLECTWVRSVVADKVDICVVAAVDAYLTKLEVRARSDGLLRAAAFKPPKDDGHSRRAVGVFILLHNCWMIYSKCKLSVDQKWCVTSQ